MRMVVIQTAEPASTIEATVIFLKIIDTIYAKVELKQVANNATRLNTEERTQLLSLLEDFEDFFDGTLGEWDTEPVKLYPKLGSKPFNSKHYPVPRINN